MTDSPPIIDVGDGVEPRLTPSQLARTTALLRDGEIVVIPTETVYGVAVDAFAPGATQRLFDLKGRGRTQPIAVLVADADRAGALGQLDERARRLAERFWPGPITLVVPRDPGLDIDLGAEVETIGLRCPDHEIARQLAERVGPLATTSANRSGEPTPNTAGSVGEVFRDRVSLIIDAGICDAAPSTVVSLVGELEVLRHGWLPEDEIRRVAADG